MAEGHVKLVLEREVTCALCLEIFKEPKKLPCDHVYCKECLKGLALYSGPTATLSCPECRCIAQIPASDVNNFPNDFRINRLVEAFQKVEMCAHEDTPLSTEKSVIDNCMDHPTQPLALYCETCGKLLCRDCVIMCKAHSQHDYNYIDQIADAHREELKDTLLVTQKLDELLTAHQTELSTIESDVVLQEGREQQQIDVAFQILIQILEEKKREMKAQLFRNSQSIKAALADQRRETKAVQNKIKELASEIESTLQGHNKTLLTHQVSLLSSFKLMQEKVGNFPPNIVREPLLLPEIMNGESLKRNLDKLSFMYYAADPTKCHIRNFVSRAKVGESYSLTLDLVDFKGIKCRGGKPTIMAELRSIRNHSIIEGDIKQDFPHCVQITFKPHMRGRHELNVKVNGGHVGNSPNTCFFYKNPQQSSQPITTIESLQRPTGLARNGEHILAVEHDRNRILRLSTSFEVAGVIGEGILKGPSEVTSDHKMNIYVCTVQDNKVHKFSKDGTLIKSIGATGTRPEQFSFPNGVRTNNYGEIYVCDSGNSRIQVFDLDLNFKRIFGSQGSGKGQFRCPSDVDFDADDNIYVVDTNNHRIQVFSRQEQYLHTIGHKRFGSKQLVSPINMHISDDQLFVTENEKSHVTVFRTSGELLTTFGNGVLSNPEGIEVDEDGFVYVTSDYSKIIVY